MSLVFDFNLGAIRICFLLRGFLMADFKNLLIEYRTPNIYPPLVEGIMNLEFKNFITNYSTFFVLKSITMSELEY